MKPTTYKSPATLDAGMDAVLAIGNAAGVALTDTQLNNLKRNFDGYHGDTRSSVRSSLSRQAVTLESLFHVYVGKAQSGSKQDAELMRVALSIQRNLATVQEALLSLEREDRDLEAITI